MIEIGPDDVTALYAKRAAGIHGAVRPHASKVYLEWSGRGGATWEASVPQPGRYEIALCCAVMVDSTDVEVTAGGQVIKTKAARTWGVFTDYHPEFNFERVPVPGVVELHGGQTSIGVSVKNALPENAFNLASVELTPVVAKDALAEDERRALAERAGTDWFVEAGYGLMFHWTTESQPRRGKQKPYANAVRDFDVERFTDTVEETGAGYVIFTANHAAPTFPASIRAWDDVRPGWTTQRDLVADMADALGRRNIRLMLYLNCRTFADLEKRTLTEYADINRRMFAEIGTRYGGSLAGYWLDSWYQPHEQFARFPMKQMFDACKEGNPQRIVAFNDWVLPVRTQWQEYWAGEVIRPARPPSGRCFQAGAGKRLQYHVLLMLDAPWIHAKPDTEMEPPHLAAEQVAAYVADCTKNQGVVTVNLGIYQDGTIGERTAELMRRVRDAIRSY